MSSNTEVVVAAVLESPMNSMAALCVDGVEQWKVFHDGTRGVIDDLDPEGTPPKQFAALRARAQTEARASEGIDFFFDGQFFG